MFYENISQIQDSMQCLTYLSDPVGHFRRNRMLVPVLLLSIFINVLSHKFAASLTKLSFNQQYFASTILSDIANTNQIISHRPNQLIRYVITFLSDMQSFKSHLVPILLLT